jgi:hypothetical protein
MEKLRDDDYLLEITVRVSVRKEDAAALISLTNVTMRTTKWRKIRFSLQFSTLWVAGATQQITGT